MFMHRERSAGRASEDGREGKFFKHERSLQEAQP